MAVNAGLAHLSDTAFTTAIAVYGLALVSYCGEYAFGRSGRVARTSAEQAPVAELVAVGAVSGGTAPPGAGVRSVRAGSRDAVVAEQSAARLAGRFGWSAAVLTTLGVILHAGSVAIRGVAVDRVPWGNMYEFSSAVGLVAVLAFLVVILRQPRVRYLGMFVMLPVILLMFLAGTVLYTKAAPLVPALRSYWLAIHVTAAIIATGIFMVSFVATVLYLIRHRYDSMVAVGITPGRFPITLGRRLPEAGVLDRIAYRTIAFGFPVWTFGIAAGAMWAEAAWGRYWGWDPKETWSFISWVVYASYLHARATAGWKGVKAARISLFGFSSMIFNFFVVNIMVSGLHSYAGLS
ncbi:MAG: c-type cytochrome biogenesis protein CcsB [Actinobacteria bacterium]|nr:c-type cytochrome biogenesis protein CcsB [Actinomycetota bacterium]MBI3685975.1 c-type cytochrome biogenesis protein CcsB [Actinomycetota bacterium]